VAHRGGAREAPENTLTAFRHAVAAGAGGVELDVRLSADGVAVVFHDDDLGRFFASTASVESLPWSALERLELGEREARFSGERIPTLAEALAVLMPLALINLELKSAANAEALAAAVARELRGSPLAGRTVVSSFDAEVVAAFARLAPAIGAGHVLASPPRDEAWLGYGWVALERRLAAAGWATQARAAGLRVLVWTENDPATLEPWRALAVDGIVTDLPSSWQR
jgi:glycerophosphoryl diester phosphodiesterase